MVSINYYEADGTIVASFENITQRPILGNYVSINGVMYTVKMRF